MPNYLLHHAHPADRCAEMFQAYEPYDTPLKGQGKTFFCTCPSGWHGGFIAVDAANERERARLATHRSSPRHVASPNTRLR